MLIDPDEPPTVITHTSLIMQECTEHYANLMGRPHRTHCVPNLAPHRTLTVLVDILPLTID
jgi:hypothetical protein